MRKDIIHPEKQKLYYVRFTLLNDEYISLEYSIHHYSKEEAVELATYVITQSLGIHPLRLCLSSITEIS